MQTIKRSSKKLKNRGFWRFVRGCLTTRPRKIGVLWEFFEKKFPIQTPMTPPSKKSKKPQKRAKNDPPQKGPKKAYF